MVVSFACGHRATVDDGVTTAPVCGCGERRIQGVAVRAPKFRGVATGPFCETVRLDPGVVNVASGAPLVVKERTDG